MSRLAGLWQRKWVRVALKALLVLLALRALVSLAAPLALWRAAASFDLEADYDELSLSFLGGSAQIEGLVVRERGAAPEAPALLTLGYGLVDVSMLSLLRGELHVERAEIDDVLARVERRADGSLPWVTHLGLDRPREPEPPDEPEPLDFTPPLRVDALRALRVGIELVDASVTPAIDETLVCALRVSGVGVEGHAATFEATATGPRLLGFARAGGRFRGGPRELSLDVDWSLERLHAQPLAGLLRRIGLEPVAEEVSARGAALLALAPAAGSDELCDATARVHSMRVDADGERALELAELRLGPATCSARGLSVDEVALEGLDLAARRHENGRLAAAGFELVPVARDDAARAPAPLEFPRLPIDPAKVTVARVGLTLDDRAVAPPTTIELGLESLVLVRDEGDPAGRVLSVHLTAPGVFERASLEGRVRLDEPRLGAELACDVFGLRPKRLRAHLLELGLEPWDREGRLTTRLVASATIAGGALREGVVTLGPTELAYPGAPDPVGRLALERLELVGLSFDPAASRVEVERIESSGLAAGAWRDEQGRLSLTGLSLVEPTPRLAAEAPEAPDALGAPGAPSPPSATRAPAPLALHIGRLTTRANRLRFDDAAVTPRVALSTEPLEATIEQLTLGAPAVDPEGARLSGTLAVPGLLERATLDGRVRSTQGGRGAQLAAHVSASGLAPKSLAPYLAAAGLEPVAERLDAQAEWRLSVARDHEAWTGSLALAQAELVDGERELASLRGLDLSGVRIDPTGALTADEVRLQSARLALAREADGRVTALGLRLIGAPQAAEAPSRPSDVELPPVNIARVALEELAVAWSDVSVAPAFETRLRAAVELEPLRLGIAADGSAVPDPAQLTVVRAELELGPELPLARVTASAVLDPDALWLQAAVDLERLRSGAFAAYLPSGVALEMVDGRAHVELRAASAPAPGELAGGSSGRSLELELSDVRLEDGGQRLATLDRLALDAARVDPAEGVFEVDSLELAGAALDVRRAADGSLHAAGLASGLRSTEPAAAEGDAPPPVDSPAAARTALTKLALARAELELARLVFVDETLGPAAEPLVLAARAELSDMQLGGGSAEGPPLRADFTGSLAPLVDAWSASVVYGESNGEPLIETHFALDGLRGDVLTRVVPGLAGTLDGGGLADGRLRASAKTVLHAPRRSNRAIDFTSPFGAEIELGPVEFRATPEGEVLAGLDGGRIAIEKVDPRNAVVAIRSIELLKPRGRVTRDAEGLHALGLTLLLPQTDAGVSAEAGETSAGAPEPEPVAPGDGSAPAPELAAAPGAGSELSIERVAIEGIDLVLADVSVSPPAIVPLVELDFELRRFTTRAFSESKALSFSAYLGAGPVDLPRRVESDSLLEGVAEALGDALAGQAEEQGRLEGRPLFDEVAVAGRIAFYPEIRGWVNVGVSALELTNFRGLAQSFGIAIGDGLLDATLRARLQGEHGISIQARPTFSYLSLSEPADGPISRYLTLPAPLDTVLFLTKDAEDQHKVPVDLRMSWDGLSTSELVSAALGAASSVIAQAVAGAPLRLLGGIGGLFGDEEVPPTDDTIALEYSSGVTSLGAADMLELERFVQRFGHDERYVFSVQHRFSAADVEHASRLANPAEQDCRELSERLRRKKAELVRRREELAARARVDYAVGRDTAATAATAELRALDRELGLNEDALDRVHELLRPGAERRRAQRTKATLIAIALERVARVKQLLVERRIDPARVEIRSLQSAAQATLESSRISLTPRKRR